MKQIWLLVFGIGISTAGLGQFSTERAAISRMEKGKWKSAEEVLRKSLKKDSLSVESNFVFSWYFLEQGNPAANIDSANRYSLYALTQFAKVTSKDKDRLKRFPIDSILLARHKRNVDSLAFDNARKINTEAAYADFLSHFKTASERAAATELRDEIAFLDALKINTYASFHRYLTLYPASIRAREAQQRYEKLLYLDKTRDGKLKSYEQFNSEFPNSTWRTEAERNIFEISTASGSISSFTAFIKRYPGSHYHQRAIALLYHLMKDDEHESAFLSDSLKIIQQQEKGYWVPFLKNGKFGFMDQTGTETVKPLLDSIPAGYNCGNIHSDYLMVAGGVINRAGAWIFRGAVDNVEDLGAGFLKVTRSNCVDVVHKSGWGPEKNCFGAAALVAHNFIAFSSNEKWGLRSLSGRVIFSPQYDTIIALDTLILFVKSGKKTVATLNKIAQAADGSPLASSMVFDDVRRMTNGNYLVKNGALEGVINNELEFIVPFDRYTISRSSAGFILEENNKYKVTGLTGVDEHLFYDDVRYYGNWVTLRSGKRIQLYNIAHKRTEAIQPDSVWFQNQLAFARHKDSLKVFLNSSSSVLFPSDNKVSFIRSVDSTRYFVVSDKKKKTIFNAVTGKRMFVFTGDAIEYIGHSSFLAVKGNKKGVFLQDGKPLLPIEYTAIVLLEGEWLTLLKDGKFGLYHLTTHKLVNPVYSRNVKPYSRKFLVAFKDTGYGFIDMDAKAQSNFEFEEIRLWNDTSAFVKKNFQWMLYSMRSKKIILNDIRDYHLISEHSGVNIAVIRKGNYYGVISSRDGELIPATFSEIVNIGSQEDPMFFSEKNVEEAGIHVVIYYDRNGKVLRKQALEEEEYDRLYCDEN